MVPRDTYTHGHHDSVLRSHVWRTAANSAAYLSPHLRAGMSMLDVGCGPGSLTLELAQRLAPGVVVGLDREPGVLLTADSQRVEAGVDNVGFVTGDVYRLEMETDSFDIVHAHQLLQHVSDPVAALTEMKRVCRPGGWVAARDSDYAGFVWVPQDRWLELWLAVYRTMARANHAEPDAGRHLLGWANQAGFSEVRSSASVWCFATVADRLWWGEMWADRVLGSAFADQALDRGLATASDLSNMADAWRRWATAPDGWFSVLHGEVLCKP